MAETLTYENLIAGDGLKTKVVLIGASQTIQRGDLLELAVVASANTGTGAITYANGSSFVRPSALANPISCYAIAADAVTTGEGESANIIAYIAGEFNEDSIRYGGSSTAAQNKDILASKGIILRAPAVEA